MNCCTGNVYNKKCVQVLNTYFPHCIVFCTVYCFMHAYDRSLVNITSFIPCLFSINSSLDDLIESVYYMLIPMQHISVIRIFTSLYIDIQSSYNVNYHALRQRVIKPPCISKLPLGNSVFLIGQAHPERRDSSQTLKGSRTVPLLSSAKALLLNLLIAARVESLSRCGRARWVPTYAVCGSVRF